MDRSVTLLFKLKHFWMSSATCVIVVALFLSMLFCHSPDIALNSLATSVGISFCWTAKLAGKCLVLKLGKR